LEITEVFWIPADQGNDAAGINQSFLNPHLCFHNHLGETLMINPYSPPAAVVDNVFDTENNSGGGSGITPPDGVKGWSWGAFFLNWIWAIFNKTYIGLLCFIPYVGFIFSFYLGFKGRELAWRNKRWDSVEHFNDVQRKWSMWAVILFFGIIGLAIVGTIAESYTY
jgi:hypothetical protein